MKLDIDSLKEDVFGCSARLVASFTRLCQRLAWEFCFYPATVSPAWFQNREVPDELEVLITSIC
jgi:hypothetical protein